MLAERDNELQYTLPTDNFDFDQIVSGHEAVMMTLDCHYWSINLNGWLCDKVLWMNVSTFKSLIINHMDADDFSAREILFNASKVAFSVAKYHYRLHPDAITKKITKKTFESVITDRLVLEYFMDTYPLSIPVIQQSLCCRMIALMRLLVINNTLLPKDEICSRKLLHQYFKKIKFTDIIKTDIPLKHKILLCLPFIWSLYIFKLIN